MKNLIKYEIKGSITILLVLVIVTFFSVMMITGGAFVMSVFIALYIIGLGLYLANSFKRELDKDSGYLTFSLPVTGRDIVRSKLIVHTLYTNILLLVLFLSLIFFVYLSYRRGSSYVYKEGLDMLGELGKSKFILLTFGLVVSQLISTCLMYLYIYLSMTVTKLIMDSRRLRIQNKAIGGWWIILYMVIGKLVERVISFIAGKLPLRINLYRVMDRFKIKMDLSFIKGAWYDGGQAILTVNLTQYLLMVVAIFLLISLLAYLLDEKIEIGR